MPARLPYQTGAQVIVVMAKVAALFEYGPTLDWWQSIYDDTQRLTPGLHVDRGDQCPVFRRSPVGEMLHRRRILSADSADEKLGSEERCLTDLDVFYSLVEYPSSSFPKH